MHGSDKNTSMSKTNSTLQLISADAAMKYTSMWNQLHPYNSLYMLSDYINSALCNEAMIPSMIHQHMFYTNV